MNRPVLFLLGALVGGVGILCLCLSGVLSHAFAYQDIGSHGSGISAGPSSRIAIAMPVVSTMSDATPASTISEAFIPAKTAVDQLAPLASSAESKHEPVSNPASTSVRPTDTTAGTVVSPGSLLIPVFGVTYRQLTDTYTQSRGAGRSHDAIDIMAARGTPVLAVNDGKVAKLFTSIPGGLTIYQFDRREEVAYYYAHMDSYAPGLAEGKQLKRGDLVGYVGSTGNASPDAPHLHFAVFLLGPEKNWWQGTAINPFLPLGGRGVPAP